MTTPNSRQRQWLLWVIAACLLVALLLLPVSYRITRAATAGFALLTWFGLIALLWRVRALRYSLLAITALVAGFLALPARATIDKAALREEYLSSMRGYEGATYYWGGENARGIDCSGLIRRGMMNAMFARGVRTFDGGLVRSAIDLWWNDCSAQALGEGYRSLTTHVADTRSLNELDHTLVTPGDLAVTQSGVHILAYLGDRNWIQADPGAGKVITLPAPARNGWFQSPMKIVRWRALE